MRKYYYGAVVFYLLSVISYLSFQYVGQRSELMKSIDRRLMQSALIANQLLPESLHRGNITSDAVDPKEDLKNRLTLSRFAQTMEIEYVYSFILKGGKLYFTSSSATPDELKNGEDISYYFDEYTEKTPILIDTFKTRQIHFEVSSDQWGMFRSVYIPHVSSDGTVYVTGADIEITDIDARLQELLIDALGEALFYMLVLIPFFVAYRIHNKNIRKDLTALVNEKTAKLQERSMAISRLLDNANQGFLTFSTSLEVEEEYSHKCVDLFKTAIEGKPIAELLYPQKDHDRELFEKTFAALFAEEDETKSEAILSLLPSEFVIGHKAIEAVYKRIEPKRCMVILTDITERKNLEINVERERKRLKMIVSVIGNSDEFFETLEEYHHFLSRREMLVDNSQTPSENLKELYRIIHTFKGGFAQQEFITTPQGLHKVESKFSSWLQNPAVSNETIQAMLTQIDFEQWLQKDIEILRQSLGDDFIDKKTAITIDDTTYEGLKSKLKELLDLHPKQCQNLMELLSMLQKLKYKSIGEFLCTLPKYAHQIAERLQKELYPVRIVDESTTVSGEEFRAFAKSLVHVIRNSVDHGIETPQERILHGKDPLGTITITISETEESVIIEIADDGAGIDLEKLREIAVENGLRSGEELGEEETVLRLIFEDYVSTKEEVSELSGRGVGLAAVDAEARKLGGTCGVTSAAGEGSRFIFTFPKTSLNKGLE